MKLKDFKHLTNWISVENDLTMKELSVECGLGLKGIDNMRGGVKKITTDVLVIILSKFPESEKHFGDFSKQENLNNLKPVDNIRIDELKEDLTNARLEIIKAQKKALEHQDEVIQLLKEIKELKK